MRRIIVMLAVMLFSITAVNVTEAGELENKLRLQQSTANQLRQDLSNLNDELALINRKLEIIAEAKQIVTDYNAIIEEMQITQAQINESRPNPEKPAPPGASD